MPRKGIVDLTAICNFIISSTESREDHNDPKHGKPLEEASSYRAISIFPIMSKTFENTLLKRLHPILDENRILPDHRFGFRQQHYHRTSTPNYRENKRKRTALRRS
jgi:hypothetical protein